MNLKRLLTASLPIIALTPALCQAHEGHDHGGVAAGLAHPLSGLDHILAMIAVGLWAAQIGGKARWALPASFVGFMVVGSLLGVSGLNMPGMEAGILASVLVLGFVIAAAFKAPLKLSIPLVALFALCHGFAHGAEAASGSFAAYGLGFVASTAILHLAGLGLGEALKRNELSLTSRVAGGLISASAVMLWLS